MGLIRSGNTNLISMSSDEELTEYLWPIVPEMIKTAIENKTLWLRGDIPFDSMHMLFTLKKIICL